jgi:hypothetical protein
MRLSECHDQAEATSTAHARFSFYLLSTIPKALGNSRRIKMMASLDHSMWCVWPGESELGTADAARPQVLRHVRRVAVDALHHADAGCCARTRRGHGPHLPTGRHARRSCRA